MTTAIKSISLSLELLSWVEKYKISLTEATRVGISVILAELGEPQFLNRVNLGRKVLRMAALIDKQQELLNKWSEKYGILEEKGEPNDQPGVRGTDEKNSSSVRRRGHVDSKAFLSGFTT